ncbi:MAG TPA: hypothetical protein VHQ45_11070 [Gemmatimonadaceae bacterium]|nr:hypothetical protein [Gemmatimonadaceae bacterium]
MNRSLIPRTAALTAIALLAAATALAGCRQDDGAARADSTSASTATASDTALENFRRDLPVVTALTGGATSRDELVAGFVRAVETSDTTALRGLVLTRAEFAHLYYPSSQYVAAPYRLDPGLLWFFTQQNSEKGIVRVLRRYGGRPMGMESYACPGAPERRGQNTLWGDCTVRFRPTATDSTLELRLFGSILERGGRYKFVGYSNDF